MNGRTDKERSRTRTYVLVPASITRFTAVKNRPWVWLSLARSIAERAGVKVTALKTDRITAKAMVRENCW